MRKPVTILSACMLLLLCTASLDSEQRARRWVDQVLDLIKPSSLDPSPQTLAIHQINNHLEEVARLRLQGFSVTEIKARMRPQQASGTGFISGDVFWDREYSVSVFAFDEFGRYAGSDYVLPSDVYGSYTIKNLSPGKYYVRTDSDHYEDRYYRNTTDWKKAKLVKVKSGKDTGHIDLSVSPQQGTGNITGQVRNKNGASLSDCQVAAYKGEYELIRTAVTDSNGMYAVTNIPSGQYKLACYSLEELDYTREWYNDSPSSEGADVVTVTEPETTAGIDFVLEVGGGIKGRVLDSSGKKVEQYRCSVTFYDEYRNYINRASTDDKGRFKFKGLKPGAYKLYIRYIGDKNCLNTWYNNAEDFSKAKVVRVKSRKLQNVKIKLRKGGVITGTVESYAGQPLAGTCAITVYDGFRNYVKSCMTGADGVYKVQGLPTGSFKLYASEDGFYSRIGDQPADEWYGEASLFSEAQAVQVKVPKTTSHIDFSLEKGGYIGGRVTPPGNQVLQWGSVTAYNRDGDWMKDGPITQDGRYFIQGLASGEYRLQASANVDGAYFTQWYAKATSFEAATAVSVSAPNAAMGIDIPLEARGYLKGYVLDAKKNRVVDAEQFVYLLAYDAENGDYAGFDTNTFVGGYSLRLFSGRYKLGAVPVYINGMGERRNLAMGYYRSGTGFYDPRSQAVSLGSASSKKLKNMLLKNAGGTISGTVYEANTNRPVSEGMLIVWVFDEDGYLVKAYGSSETRGPMTGDYILPGLRPGNYYILMWFFHELDFERGLIQQWYNGLDVQFPVDLFIPKLDIPAGAYAVVVGTGETKGIDFYVDHSN